MENTQDQQTLLTRTKDLPIPPDNLDLLDATAAKLREYGLPPRPSPELEPELFKVWKEFYVPRPIFVQAKVALVRNEFRPQLRLTSATIPAAAASTTRYETSRNWSGAYIEPNHAKVFVQLSGRWKVPTPAVPPGAEPPPQGSVDYACSTWIGFDGQRRYIDSSLPQLGTWQAVTLAAGGTTTLPETYAWYQWWAKDYSGNAPGKITGVPVNPDDEVVCMVRVWQPSVAAMYIKNLRTNLHAHFLVSAPIVTLRGGHQHQFTISGATAEWVMERPTRLDNGELYDLAYYYPVKLRHCHAAEANPTMPNWPWVVGTNQTFKGARFIQMYDLLKNPWRTAFISMPKRKDDTAVRVKYGGFPG